MTRRTFDEQISNFNRVVSRWDINQEYKVALLGMIASLGYEHEKSINPEPHWIPVTERLPEKGNTSYLATLDYGEYGMAVGQRFFFGDNIGWIDEAVIAWMPLPEPYKGVNT